MAVAIMGGTFAEKAGGSYFMLVIGLIGGIGTGKSTVSLTLQELGATLLNMDLVGHEMQKKGTDAWKDIVATWGSDLIDPQTGAIDRRKLGPIVFGDPAALQKLNQIMWPRMKALTAEKLATLYEQGVKVAVVESALLIEAGWQDLVDEIWCTVADEEEVVRRLAGRNNLTREDALRRIRSQMPQEERAKQAAVVIDTNCTMDEVKQKVISIWNSRVQPQVSK
jgi:dephospho-CoA kinase